MSYRLQTIARIFSLLDWMFIPAPIRAVTAITFITRSNWRVINSNHRDTDGIA